MKKLVKITWLDSKGVIPEWEYLDGIKPLTPCVCTSVGFILEETDKYKTIAQSISDTQVLGRMTIPCCSITSIRSLR